MNFFLILLQIISVCLMAFTHIIKVRAYNTSLGSSASDLLSPTAAAVPTAYSLQPTASIRPVGRIVTSLAITKIFFGFLTGFILTIAGITICLISNCTSSTFLNSLAALFLYFILAYCYYHFVNIGEASIRLRIFSELSQNKNRLLSKLAYADEVQEVDGAEKLSVQELLDASSTDATQQFAAEVAFRKKSYITVEGLQAYQQKELPSRRIERLLAHGDILLEDNLYRIGKKRYLIAAKILLLAKKILNIRPVGRM